MVFRELYAAGVSQGAWLGCYPRVEGGDKQVPLDHMDVEAADHQTVRIGINGDADLALRVLSYISYTPLQSHLGDQVDKWTIVDSIT